MTNNYKDNLLSYFVGDFQEENGNNVPLFGDVIKNNNNFGNNLNQLFPYNFFVDGIIQGKDANNNEVANVVIYGTFYTTASRNVEQSFIVVVDDNFNIKGKITNYYNGSDFGIFKKLNVGDDGSFFGIEEKDGIKRFVMLNNIVAKLPTDLNYKVVLRKSYNLQGRSNEIVNYNKIEKVINQSKYLICGSNISSSVICTELKINVGSENSWIDYVKDFANFDVYDFAIDIMPDDEIKFDVYGFFNEENGNIRFGKLKSQRNEDTTDLIIEKISGEYENVVMISLKVSNYHEIYYSITQSDLGSLNGRMKLYSYIDNRITLINDVETMFDVGVAFVLFSVAGETFYYYNVSEFFGDPWKLKIGKIIGNNCYEKEVDRANEIFELSFFIIQKQFNLYTYTMQINNTLYTIKQIYNKNEYNGNEYKSIQSLVPNSANLYSDDIVIFSNNLYNRIINNNVTISTLNVPNNFVNDVLINSQELLSPSKNIISKNDKMFSTNIYEELMINFINSIFMINKNNLNDPIENKIGATRINKSVSNPELLDYNEAKAKKYRINYADGTNEIKIIEWTKIRNYYQAKILIQVEKEITNIQIISDDENTIYQEIVGNFELNKSYIIKQDAYTNKKILADDVFYNNDKVYYNNDEVLY